MLWQAMNQPIPQSLKNVIILCGSNNILIDFPTDIADCIVNIGSCLCQNLAINIFISGNEK